MMGMICGENELTKSLGMFIEKTCGCGREIQLSEVYRCIDCGVPFHRTCLRIHFSGCRSMRFPFDPYDKSDKEKAQAIHDGLLTYPETCPECSQPVSHEWEWELHTHTQDETVPSQGTKQSQPITTVLGISDAIEWLRQDQIERAVDVLVAIYENLTKESPVHPDYFNVAANIWQNKKDKLFYYSDDTGFHGPFQFAIEAQEALKREGERTEFEIIVRIGNRGTMSGYDASTNTYLDPVEQEMWIAWQSMWDRCT